MTRPRLSLSLLTLLVLVAGCDSLTRIEPSVRPTATHFHFAQITDTHLGQSDHAARCRKLVGLLNNADPAIDFVIHTGDITHDQMLDAKTIAQAKAIASGLTMPLHYLAGNHDILSHQAAATRKAYEKAFGPLVQSFEHKGVIFILAYTEPLARGFTIDGYDVLRAVEAELKKAGDKPIIVAHHAPSAIDYGDRLLHPGWKDDARIAWAKLLNRYKVIAVLAGHLHRNARYRIGDVPVYVQNSVTGHWTGEGNLRIYEYRNRKLTPLPNCGDVQQIKQQERIKP